MDKADMTIINSLWFNSRIPLRELADKLDLSVNSVHKRINNLVEEGVIEKFFLMPCNLHLDSVSVLLFGNSNSPTLDKAINKLAKNGNVTKVITGVDNWVMLSAHLRNISEIDAFTEEAVRELAMEDYVFGLGIDKPSKHEPVSLSKLDYQICHSMANNSRKSITDVAEELGVTPKTVKRRLHKMEMDEALYAGIDWQPSMSDDILSYMCLTLKPGVTRKEIIADLTNNYKPEFMIHYSFSNLPDFLMATFWSKKMGKINDIQQRLKKSGKFKNIVSNVQYKAYHFDSWTNVHVKKMAASKQ